MKFGPIAQFVAIGVMIGIVAPCVLSLCLFGLTLQVVMAAEPTSGYWSGAPTPGPTPVPSRAQAWTSDPLKNAGRGVLVLWSILGGLAGISTAPDAEGPAAVQRRGAAHFLP